MDLVESACLSILIVRRRRKKKLEKCCVHPILSECSLQSSFHTLHNDLRQYQETLFNYYRMNVTTFDALVHTQGLSE